MAEEELEFRSPEFQADALTVGSASTPEESICSAFAAVSREASGIGCYTAC